jgi:DNA-binding NtrC family response regulator
MILLIDDNDNERAIIRKMLESGGHQVREASGGDDGVAQFRATAPALVLCDLMMPHKDGFDTIAEMQALAPAAKFIAMSGVWYGPSDHAAMARTLGLRAVIEKPFNRTELLELVSRIQAQPAVGPAGATAKRKRAAKKAPAKKARPKAKAKKARPKKPKARRPAAKSRKPTKPKRAKRKT